METCNIAFHSSYFNYIFDRFLIKDKVLDRPFTEFGGYIDPKNNFFSSSVLYRNIVKSIVEAMGSQVNLDSEVNKGSCFYFEMSPINHSPLIKLTGIYAIYLMKQVTMDGNCLI